MGTLATQLKINYKTGHRTQIRCALDVSVISGKLEVNFISVSCRGLASAAACGSSWTVLFTRFKINKIFPIRGNVNLGSVSFIFLYCFKQLSMFVRFLLVYDLLSILFKIAWWPSAGKDLSSWLAALAVLIYAISIICVPFPF